MVANIFANAMLKTLEEPPPDTHFILITSKFNEILPTIISRSVQIPFQEITSKNIYNYLINELKTPTDLASLYSHLACGNLEKAICLHHEKKLLALDLAILFLKICINKNYLQFYNFLGNNFKKEDRNFDLIYQILQYILLFFRDINVFIFDKKKIIFHNEQELLNKYSKSNIKNNLFSLINEIESFYHSISVNVNVKLIITQCFFKIVDYI
jgi:DNA polymerase-3 subunit delta'